MAATDDKFNAENVLKLFKACRQEDDILDIDCYVNGYEELSKLFRLFGSVFSFVSSDVDEKIGILRDYRKSEVSQEYKTVQSMLKYEVAKSITDNKKKASGARTLLRLHRALEFISAILKKIRDSDNKKKFSGEAVQAYDSTLAKHHPWLVKKGVHVAMLMLPSRPDLMKKLNLDESPQKMGALTELIQELNKIFDITEKLYAEDKLLDLP